MKDRDRGEIIRVIGTQYSSLPSKKGSQRSSRSPEQAFCSSEGDGRGDRGGTRRGRGRGGSGGQGRGPGKNNDNGGPQSNSISGRGRGGAGSTGSSGTNPTSRCFRCGKKGHVIKACTTKESDFVVRCGRCSGYGHDEKNCPSDVAVMAMELPTLEDDLTAEAEAYMVQGTGEKKMTARNREW